MKKLFNLLSLSLLMISVASCASEVDYSFKEEKDTSTYTYTLNESKVEEMQLVHENDNFKFSYREDNDNIMIYDKRNNHCWTTGVNACPYSEEYYNNLSRTERQAFGKKYTQIEVNMTDQYLALANSLITLRIYKESGANYSVSPFGSSLIGVDSKLYKVDNESNHFKFVVDYTNCTTRSLDIQIKADIYFNEEGYDIKILDQNITGKDAILIKDILITPFLGAEGGTYATYNSESRSYEPHAREFNNGYAVVPDGSGAIINLTDNETPNLTAFNSAVYGQDPSRTTSYGSTVSDVLALKNTKMPVFGVAFEQQNAAFVGFAKSGSEYMSICLSPDNSNNVNYAWTYPSFSYNVVYTQIYNKAGSTYSKLMDERNHFTLEMQYDFLANSDANYVGMANNYKKYLKGAGELSETTTDDSSIPLRLDFIMSDTEAALVGSTTSITTTANQLEDILVDVNENLNVSNSVVSLYGWQKEGKYAQHPSKTNFTSNIGSASKFNSLMKKMNERNYDVSFAQDYYNINSDQMAYLNNAAKHINGYYNKYFNYKLAYKNESAFARADRSNQFVKKQINSLKRKTKNMSSFTVDGISYGLVSNLDTMSRNEAKQYIQDSFNYIKEKDLKVNAIAPNSYLWKYVDRYFDADSGDSSLLIETESVPFLQMVLNNTMEVYSTYCNFSFYDDASICKMIDYNIYPSFMLTSDSAYYLLMTNSNLYFSTQYSGYRNLIEKIYAQVNGALSQVINATWTNREYKDNVAINTYSNGKKIYINYNSEAKTVNGVTVNALSYEVI